MELQDTSFSTFRMIFCLPQSLLFAELCLSLMLFKEIFVESRVKVDKSKILLMQ